MIQPWSGFKGAEGQFAEVSHDGESIPEPAGAGEKMPVPHGDRSMHEFVAAAAGLMAERGVSAMDLAKRLLDYGFHPPTVYFPLIVREAMMIEPTETESKATLDAFADALQRMVEESPELLHGAPHSTPVCRPDEVTAARRPVLRWREEG